MKSNSGHPLRELARRAKTSAAALVDYEAGRHEPKFSTLQRIAEASGCDLFVEVRPRPVSYTHLDVYKRQLLDNATPLRSHDSGTGSGR